MTFTIFEDELTGDELPPLTQDVKRGNNRDTVYLFQYWDDCFDCICQEDGGCKNCAENVTEKCGAPRVFIFEFKHPIKNCITSFRIRLMLIILRNVKRIWASESWKRNGKNVQKIIHVLNNVLR